MRWKLAVIVFAICIASIASNGQGTSYLGFDRNEYPGDDQLSALHQDFAFIGYWLNNPPGARANTWTGRRAAVEKIGLGFLILFNGKTYAQLKGREAAELGSADGMEAVASAKREGFPQHAVIFLDQEEGGRLLGPQKAYLYAWVDAVSSGGYRSGVYCSGIPSTESSGETVVTADDIVKNAAGRHIILFVANDACPPSPGCVLSRDLTPGHSGTGAAEIWQFAQSPRRPNLTNSCGQSYASDGNCYPPRVSPDSRLHVDLDVALTADPSHGRTQP